MRIDTQIIHGGEPRPRIDGAVCVPIYQSAMFEYTGDSEYHDLRYLRLNNSPNHLALHAKLALLEGAEAGLVTASGMAAISTTLLANLAAGDHLLTQDSLYGGTYDLIVRDFAQFGIEFDFLHADPKQWVNQVKPNTKLVYTESITNPTLKVIDHSAVVEFAKSSNLLSLIDNTFTPLNFRPLDLGYDLVMHSCTKYLNGHSDIVAGAVLGSQILVKKVLHRLNHLGGSLDSHTCFLLQRGLKTLGVRLRHQNESGLRLAQFLADSPSVARVYYPGLPSSPFHTLAKSLFTGFGGVFSFELAPGIDANTFMGHTQLPMRTFSFGGVESLIIRPAQASHVGLTLEEQLAVGINPGLIRMSVGLEDPQDLIDDLAQALDTSKKANVC